MDFYSLKDTLNNADYNALVYLLRKFKKLTCDLKLGASIIESDYGTFNFSDGFVNVGNNWILEDTVTVTSNDVLKNTFYSFHFTVINVDTSGIVNRRVVTVTGGTGDTGVLVLEIPSDIINNDEVILPDYKCSVVFDEHEYYTPLPDVHVDLSVDKFHVGAGETVTVTGVVTDGSGSPLGNVGVSLNVNGTSVSVTTDTMGMFSYSYTGTGRGWVVVSCNESSVTFYDGDIVVATVTGNSITLGRGSAQWLLTTGDVIVDWGDGSTDTVNNPDTSLTHTYSDGLSSHDITFIGTVTRLGNYCFYNCFGLTSIFIPDIVTSLGDYCFRGCEGLTSIFIPDSVTSLGDYCFFICSGLTSVTIPGSVTSLGYSCFRDCSGLTSVTIPGSVTNLGNYCFRGCTALVDYELYWETQPVTYDSAKMIVNNGTVFTIPHGTTSIYTDAGYPVANLVERGTANYNLVLSSTTPIIQKEGTAIVNAVLTRDDVAVSGETLNYVIEHNGSVLDSGSVVTGSDGNASVSYTGSGVGDVSVEVSYGTLLQETYEVQDCIFYDPLTSNSGKWTIPSGVSFGYNEYSSDGWKIGNASSFVRLDPNVSLTLPCKVSFKLMDRYSYTPQLDVGNDYVYFNDTHLNINETNLYATISNNKEYSFIIRSDSIEAYQDDTYLGKVNISISQTNLRLSIGNNRYFKIKDFKVKAL